MKVSSSAYASVEDGRFFLDKHCVNATDVDSHDCFVPKVFDQMVFILIDALRHDFVLTPQTTGDKGLTLSQMKYLKGLIEMGVALGFTSKAHPPTVTLPRIKVENVCLYILRFFYKKY